MKFYFSDQHLEICPRPQFQQQSMMTPSIKAGPGERRHLKGEEVKFKKVDAL